MVSSEEYRAGDAMHAGCAEGMVGASDGVFPIDRPASILDHVGFETRCPAVDGGVADAVVISQAGEKNARQFAFAQVGGQTGTRAVIILEECGVGIDAGAKAL